MKCVILGGGGFIGSAIVQRLLRDGHSLRIFERPHIIPFRKFNFDESVEWMSGDMSSVRDVRDAISGCDIVLHLVSSTLPKNSNDDPIFDVQSNLITTLQLLDTMVQQRISKIIFISSGGTVYGPPKYLPIDEKHPTNPLVSYGVTKLAIEKYLSIYERLHGIRAITLRVANPYGERQRIETAQGAVGVFLYRAIKSLPIEIWGDGTITRDYIHVSDVAEAIAKAIEYSGSESVFNIGAGLGTSLNELIFLLEEVLDKTVIRKYLPGRPFDVPISVLSNKLANHELAWRPIVSIRDGIARTAEWMKNQYLN